MASGVPIVASDIPALREILNEKNAVLVKPNDPAVLARGIQKVLSDHALATSISRQAFEDVQKFTWENRAKSICEFIKS